ncbi:hypothetical protein D3C72_396290 [compost metagenome]
MKLLSAAPLAALVLAGCTGSPAASGGGPSVPASAGVAIAVSEAVDSNLSAPLQGPATVLPTGSLGMSVITKQNWGLIVMAKGIAAGSAVAVGPMPADEAGKGIATFNADGKTWVSQSGTITFEQVGSITSGGAVVRFADVVFKANPQSGNKATGSFKLNGTINGVAASAL